MPSLRRSFRFAQHLGAALCLTIAGNTWALALPGLPADAVDQGVNEREAAAAEDAIQALIGNDRVDMVVTYRQGTDGVWAYEIHARRTGGNAFLRFRRVPEGPGFRYEILEAVGPDLLAQDDPAGLATRAAEEAAAGEDGVIEPEDQAYPYLIERTSILFDDPNAGDLYYYSKPGHGTGGHHGHPDVTQSRAPLILSGAGIADAGTGALNAVDTLVKAVDIAPTLAKLIGVAKRSGFTLNGQPSDDVYLLQQDGRVLDELLVPGASADYSVIIVSDGMSATLMQALMEAGELPNLAALAARGVWVRYGSIVGYPSVTYPNHNTIGVGAYSAHHGLLSNHYYDRAQRKPIDPISDFVRTEKYLSPDVETLFEAVNRTFGRWHRNDNPAGAYTASINDPCSRGAVYASLEFRTGLIGDARQQPINPYGQATDELKLEAGRLANDASVGMFDGVYGSFMHPKPKHTQVNLPLTDVAGHMYGPLAPAIPSLYKEADAHVGEIVQALEDEGILDRTVIAFTADHGMEHTNASYDSVSPGQSMSRAHVRFMQNGGNVYLQSVRLDLTGAEYVVGQPASTRVTVLEDDAFVSGEQPVVPDTAVTLYNGDEVLSGNTDESGAISFNFVPLGETVVVGALHPSFNPATATVQVVTPTHD